MLDQTAITFFTTIGGFIVGIGSTVITSILPNHISKKAEKEKLFLEKCEELYTLSIKVKKSVDKKLERLWDLYNMPIEHLDSTNEEMLSCPIDEVVSLTVFYTASLKEIAKKHSNNVHEVQTVFRKILVYSRRL